jgi:hypothetical protein
MNIEDKAAATVGLWQETATVSISLSFDVLSLLWAWIQCLSLACYISALLLIKLLILLVMKPWCFILWLLFCVCSHFWLQDKEFQIEQSPQNQMQIAEETANAE